MDQRLTLVTLGVQDLARARRFYEEGLGFAATADSNDDVRFYDVGGVRLGLWSRRLLAAEIGEQARGSGFRGFSLAHNVASREAVDAVLADALRAGASKVRPAAAREWGGYSGYFADPDGFWWEVAHNPFW